MIHLSTFYRPFFVVFSFCFLLFSSNSVLADTIYDYTSLSGSDNGSSFNNVSYKWFTIHTADIDSIDSFSLKFNDIGSYTLTANVYDDLGIAIATSTTSLNGSGIGYKTFNFSPAIDVSLYTYIKIRIKNSNGAYITIYNKTDSSQSIDWFYKKIQSAGTETINTITYPGLLTGTLKPDDCPVCEICDYDDDIPYGVPFLNDVTMVTGYTESYDASTSEMLTIEKKYYHIPAVAIFFLSTVVIIVMSRLIAELLKRISKK